MVEDSALRHTVGDVVTPWTDRGDIAELDPDVAEHNYYAPGVGVVLAVMVEGGDERMELVDIKTSDEVNAYILELIKVYLCLK